MPQLELATGMHAWKHKQLCKAMERLQREERGSLLQLPMTKTQGCAVNPASSASSLRASKVNYPTS